MRVHADVLRMARTEEKRERIKWFYARRVFFDRRPIEGLMLARESNHPDARFLLSLFRDGAPETMTQAERMFLGRRDDARCCCWAALCVLDPHSRNELLRQSAERGYAWGCELFGLLYDRVSPKLRTMWLEKAAVQGEVQAMYLLSRHLMEAGSEIGDEARGKRLMMDAAGGGAMQAQFDVGHFCATGSLEQLQWMHRAAEQGSGNALSFLLERVIDSLQQYDAGASGRLVFEFGAAFSGKVKWHSLSPIPEVIAAADRAARLYERWLREVEQSILCWIWLARQEKVAKDIRLVIANLVWDERSAWSERSGKIQSA